ncbi:hypothetical protein UVI_02007790 [Ustilaginoidea virens]|uniref:Uncharacterized protein n=1 Tax=Ustilaginoidea virens TaxID=1159556 RepID=A0A1B5KVC3_USTVR|nr:hypothetical protein UVI_02007790 [Ustilaginoidea virens]
MALVGWTEADGIVLSSSNGKCAGAVFELSPWAGKERRSAETSEMQETRDGAESWPTDIACAMYAGTFMVPA